MTIFDDSFRWQFLMTIFDDLWYLRHWLQYWQLRTWFHDNLCYLTINCDTGQHSQFLQCLRHEARSQNEYLTVVVFFVYHQSDMATSSFLYDQHRLIKSMGTWWNLHFVKRCRFTLLPFHKCSHRIAVRDAWLWRSTERPSSGSRISGQLHGVHSPRKHLQ